MYVMGKYESLIALTMGYKVREVTWDRNQWVKAEKFGGGIHIVDECGAVVRGGWLFGENSNVMFEIVEDEK